MKRTVANLASGPGRPRTLLVGTALSVAQLEQMLGLIEPRPDVVGCLLPEAAVEAADLSTPVLGALNELDAWLVRGNFDQILVSLPAAMGELAGEVARTLQRQGASWRFLPTLADQLAGRAGGRLPGLASPGGLTIDPAQLIDRQPRPLHEDSIRDALTGKRVLITGAGGSIGSEIARVVCRFRPARLLLVERSENALFEIDREIARVFPKLPREAVLHDVTHRSATAELLDRLEPEVIFHAAAHKHVPMMEDHPAQAVENNFYGTRSIADAADACGAERFVMISSDKAVNPSSVMGATKRLAELYVQHLSTKSATTFAMVRFGNVLGSACSVLPIWADQIARGGPVTVTHPEMSRYFMTIPEAAGLVLQAGALAGRDAGAGEAEVFLLDMGEPVKIVDLARRFIRSQGFEPDVDVRVEFTGVRPGEKLLEVLAYDSEDMTPTPHASIHLWRTRPPSAARMQQILGTFERLRNRANDPAHPWRSVSGPSIVTAIHGAIPEMVAAEAG
ncbi:MAG: polysaccharide biosynthesis protein [Phycisphaeraceae bacterium]